MLDIDWYEVELEIVYVRIEQLILLCAGIENDTVLIQDHLAKRPTAFDELGKISRRYTRHFFEQFVHLCISLGSRS